MDSVYFIYGLGTCKLNENRRYECKDIENGDKVELEHLWFVTEDEYKAEEMIKFNLTDLNDGGVYPYLGLQQVRLNDIIPKHKDLIVYKYNKATNEYYRVGHVKNLVRDEGDMGFIPEPTELTYLDQEQIDAFYEARKKRHLPYKIQEKNKKKE